MTRYSSVDSSSVAAPSMNEKRRPLRVGDHAGGNLEDDHADGEEGVGREGLGVVEPGVQQEERVDAPDERGSQRRQQRQQQVDTLDLCRGRAHEGRWFDMSR